MATDFFYLRNCNLFSPVVWGWIVEPEDPIQLAKTIQYVYEHPIEDREKGEKARAKCKREYSWDVMEKKLIAIFEKCKTD